MADRSKDWLAQARRDLEHADKDVRDGYFEHACFEAQQAAEKAVKSAFMVRRAVGWGRRVAKLLQELGAMGEQVPSDLVDDGKILDQYYVPARYPNGFESGAPMEFFTREQAVDAVQRASDIISWCESLHGSQPG